MPVSDASGWKCTPSGRSMISCSTTPSAASNHGASIGTSGTGLAEYFVRYAESSRVSCSSLATMPQRKNAACLRVATVSASAGSSSSPAAFTAASCAGKRGFGSAVRAERNRVSSKVRSTMARTVRTAPRSSIAAAGTAASTPARARASAVSRSASYSTR